MNLKESTKMKHWVKKQNPFPPLSVKAIIVMDRGFGYRNILDIDPITGNGKVMAYLHRYVNGKVSEWEPDDPTVICKTEPFEIPSEGFEYFFPVIFQKSIETTGPKFQELEQKCQDEIVRLGLLDNPRFDCSVEMQNLELQVLFSIPETGMALLRTRPFEDSYTNPDKSFFDITIKKKRLCCGDYHYKSIEDLKGFGQYQILKALK